MNNVASRNLPAINVRMPQEMYDAISRRAAENGRSRSSEALMRLRSSLEQEDKQASGNGQN